MADLEFSRGGDANSKGGCKKLLFGQSGFNLWLSLWMLSVNLILLNCSKKTRIIWKSSIEKEKKTNITDRTVMSSFCFMFFDELITVSRFCIDETIRNIRKDDKRAKDVTLSAVQHMFNVLVKCFTVVPAMFVANGRDKDWYHTAGADPGFSVGDADPLGELIYNFEEFSGKTSRTWENFGLFAFADLGGGARPARAPPFAWHPSFWDLFLSISCTFYLKTGCAPPHLRQNSAPPFAWHPSFWWYFGTYCIK